MRESKSPEGNCPDADPSMMTRSEALADALKARRTPEPDRAYSTLIQRSDVSGAIRGHYAAWAGDAPVTEPMRAFLDGEIAYVEGLERLLHSVLAHPSPSVPAGGADGNRDEAQNEQSAVPDPPACAQED